MAFNLQHFQFGRGTTSSYTQGQGFTIVLHTYTSDVDTMATINGANYFPASIDGDDAKIFINDLLFIRGTDGESLVLVETLAPFTYSANLLGASGSFIVAAPVNPTDNNALIFSGGSLKAEYASGSHPGIVSVNNQGFAGIKAFNDGANVFGQGLSTNKINSTGAFPLIVGDDGFTTSIDVTPIINASSAGININSGTTITSYTEESGTFTWQVAFATPPTVNWYLQKNNNWVTLFIKGMTSASPAGAATGSADSGIFIPAAYRPAATIDAPVVLAVSNGTTAVGLVNVNAAGNVAIFATAAGGLFANAGNNQIHEISIRYNVS